MKAIALSLWGLLFAVLLAAAGAYVYLEPVRTINNFQTAIAERDSFTIRQTADVRRIGEGLRGFLNEHLAGQIIEDARETPSGQEVALAALTVQISRDVTAAVTTEDMVMQLLLGMGDSGYAPEYIGMRQAFSGDLGGYDGLDVFAVENRDGRVVVERYGLMQWRIVTMVPTREALERLSER